MPVWASLLLLGAARFSGPGAPAPAPAPETTTTSVAPKSTSPPKSVLDLVNEEKRKAEEATHRAEAAEARLAACNISLVAAEQRVKDLEAVGAQPTGPVAVFFNGFAHQSLLAVLIAVFGLFGVIGPLGFWHVYKVAAGTLLGGLLLASSLNFLCTAPSGQTWATSANKVFGGGGTLPEYLLCALGVVVGTVRWWKDWDWVLYDVVQDVEPAAAPLLGDSGQQYEPPAAGDAEAAAAATAAAAEAKASAVDRIVEVVRQVAEEADNDPRSMGGWHMRFWAAVVEELGRGDMPDEVVVALIQQGFNPEVPQTSQVPDLMGLYEMLEGMRDGFEGSQAQARSSNQYVDEV